MGPEDQWTIDENSRMHLNGIPTNMHSAQRVVTPGETEVFQTPPTAPRYQDAVEEDDGVSYSNRILPACQDSSDMLSGYQLSSVLELVLDKDQFLMTDSWGDNVPVAEQEDLTFISKSTFWRVGHDFTLQIKWKE